MFWTTATSSCKGSDKAGMKVSYEKDDDIGGVDDLANYPFTIMFTQGNTDLRLFMSRAEYEGFLNKMNQGLLDAESDKVEENFDESINKMLGDGQ